MIACDRVELEFRPIDVGHVAITEDLGVVKIGMINTGVVEALEDLTTWSLDKAMTS